MNVFAMWLKTGPTMASSRVRREHVGELEFDLARIVCERMEAPFAVKVTERTVAQCDDDRLRGAIDVVGGEVGFDVVIVDVDARSLAAGVLFDDLRPSAPR